MTTHTFTNSYMYI